MAYFTTQVVLAGALLAVRALATPPQPRGPPQWHRRLLLMVQLAMVFYRLAGAALTPAVMFWHYGHVPSDVAWSQRVAALSGGARGAVGGDRRLAAGRAWWAEGGGVEAAWKAMCTLPSCCLVLSGTRLESMASVAWVTALTERYFTKVGQKWV